MSNNKMPTEPIDVGPTDVGQLIDEGRWSVYAKMLVALTAVSLVLDGFDSQALGFALPAIIRDWKVDRSVFAPVVAIGLVGMTLGAGLGGMMGDRIGRKTALISSVLVFALATAAVAFCGNIGELAGLRFLAGVGIGGALPNASALAAEFSPLRRRPLAIGLTIVCVPLGGMLGGLIAAYVLPNFGWRSLFLLGGLAPLLFAGVIAAALAESPRFLVRRPARRKELSSLLARLGHTVADGAAFVDRREAQRETKSSVSTLFAVGYRRETIILWCVFFFSLFSVYSVFNWAPAFLTHAGFELAAASRAVAGYNFGGVLGSVFCAWLIVRAGSRTVMIAMAVMGAASAGVLAALSFSRSSDHAWLMFWLAAHGFFVNAVQTTLYALAAHIYPTAVRSSGAGAALSVGRIGAIVSAFTGAYFSGQGPIAFYLFLALAMSGAAVCLCFIRGHIAAPPPRLL